MLQGIMGSAGLLGSLEVESTNQLTEGTSSDATSYTSLLFHTAFVRHSGDTQAGCRHITKTHNSAALLLL